MAFRDGSPSRRVEIGVPSPHHTLEPRDGAPGAPGGKASEAPYPSCALRTLKEQLLWVRTFDTVEELRVALLDFKERYNREWLCERHGHQTPAAVRARWTQGQAA